MKIAVVDDDIKAFEYLKENLSELLGSSNEIIYFKSGEEFLEEFEPELFDFIILDIFMDKITGMDAARKIRNSDKSVKIVFCTSSNEFASESYEVNACYYLHKPFGSEQLKAMLDRLNLAQIEKMRTVRLPDGTTAVLRNIIFADFSSHCVTLHCKRGENTVIRAPFSKIEPLLCSYPYFFSPSKGIIVNFYEVALQGDGIFKMSDGSVIPISRRRAKDVIEAYSSFRFELLRKGDEL